MATEATIWVKAGEGRRVRMPNGKIIAGDQPTLVRNDGFAARRLLAGDFVAADGPLSAPATPATPAAAPAEGN
jgi:hypothetical protein